MQLLRLELKKIRKPVLTALLGGTVLACILTCTLYRSYRIHFVIDPWEIGTEYLGLLYPLFVTVPICWQLYYERRDRFLIYTLSRVPKNNYLLTKWTACALSAYSVLFVPYFLSALCALYATGPHSLSPPSEGYVHVFHKLYTESPLIYALFLSLWKGLLGVLVMTFGYVLALYSKNLFVILTAPFIYAILENFAWSILGFPQYCLNAAFEPSWLTPAIRSAASYIIGPLLLCAVTGFTALYYAKIKRYTVYGVG